MRQDDKGRKNTPKPKKARPGAVAVTFLCCVLGVPTAAQILPGIAAVDAMAALQAGILLGLAYLLLRPLFKIAAMPLGCLTLGFANFAIDVGMLYGCAYLIEGFAVNGIVDAALTAVLINVTGFIAGGFR